MASTAGALTGGCCGREALQGCPSLKPATINLEEKAMTEEATTPTIEPPAAKPSAVPSSWEIKQDILTPRAEGFVLRGLAMLDEAEAMIRNGDVDKGGALQSLALTFIHLS